MRSPGMHDQSGNEAEASVARLVRLAGVRPAPNSAIEQSVRGAVERQWRAQTRLRRVWRARPTWLTAALAALVLGLAWVAVKRAGEALPAIVATLVGTRGPVQVLPTSANRLVRTGDELVSGTRIDTRSNGAALLSFGRVRARLGPQTLLELTNPQHVRLLHGRLYIDSGERIGSDRELIVTTEFGTIEHRGTQYQVEVQSGRFMYVCVREGRAEVSANGQMISVHDGEGLRVAGPSAITREAVRPYEDRWRWISEFVPEFSIDGRPLSVFLEWFARETGRRLMFVAPATRAAAERTILSGSISGLSPQQALEAVLATTSFRYDISVPGELRISMRSNGTVNMGSHAAATLAATDPS
jgi:hypothetical protein